MFIQVLMIALAGYLSIGLLFGLYFVMGGAGRIDPGARGVPPLFRILILPGSIALWPWLAVRVMRAADGEAH